jgi:hypothetical protein
MPRLQFGYSTNDRNRGDLPPMVVVNMFAEEAPTEETGVVLQSRKGILDRVADMGAGPVKQLFQLDGVLTSDLFGVSNGNLYRDTASLGAIVGSGPVSITGNEIGLVVTAGGAPRYYDGTTLSNIAFPDAANVSKVLEGASRFIFLRAGTGKFYWSPALAATVGALDFATAETSPDALLDAVFIDDTLVLFGSETVEFWPNTGSATLPFQPLEGRVFERGIRATGCAAIFGSSFLWVGDDDVVYANGQEPQRVSNSGLEEEIAASATCSVFTYYDEGIQFFAVRVDSGTWVYSLRSGTWSEMRSSGQANWIPQCYANGVFGSAINGKTLAFSSLHTDLGGTLERRFTAGFPLNAGGIPISNMSLRTNVGQTPYLTGTYTNPVVERRISRDAGQTWGNWKSASLGAQGEYRKKVRWGPSGMASQPGFLVEFRVTDPVPFRCGDALFNEVYGGR